MMGHWYDKDGEPRHFEGKDGKGTTLREARKLNLFPSVTTISSIQHKQGLVNWLQEEAAIAAGEHLLVNGMDFPDDDERVWARKRIAEARLKVNEKADAGTDIHDMLEKFVEDPFGVDEQTQNLCHAVIECIEENTGLSLLDHFIPEQRFCDTSLGYAGMCDLHTPADLVIDGANDVPWVIDYKTKDFVDSKTRGWPNQAEQLAAYSHGLGIPDARLANVFIPRTPDEDGNYVVTFYEHNDPMAWHRFRHALYLWQVTNKYGPYYEALLKERKGG
jgi:hypothetical protein